MDDHNQVYHILMDVQKCVYNVPQLYYCRGLIARK
jgi:hypothetical protein